MTDKVRNMVEPTAADTPAPATDPMLLALDEARLMGKHESAISRARKDSSHPANGPHAVRAGRSAVAPRSLILAWWKGQGVEPGQDRPRAGRPRTRPLIPAGLTEPQWLALQGMAAGEAVPTAVRARLVDKRLIGRRGALTAKGKQLLAEFAPPLTQDDALDGDLT